LGYCVVFFQLFFQLLKLKNLAKKSRILSGQKMSLNVFGYFVETGVEEGSGAEAAGSRTMMLRPTRA
jgi:hypothetical protein